MTDQKQICDVCKSLNEENAKFCAMCGASLSKENESVVIVKKKRKKKEGANKYPIRILLRNCALLLISLLLVVFTFLPVYKVEVPIEKETVSVRYSLFDTFSHFIASQREWDKEDIEDSELREEMLEESEELYEDLDFEDFRLTRRQERKVEKIAKRAVLLALSNENATASAALIISFALCVVFFLLCIAVFVLALLNFIFFLLQKGNVFRVTVILISALAAMIPAIYMANISGYLSYFGNAMNECEMGGGLILPLILSLAVIIYIGVEKIILTKRLDSVGGTIKKGAVLILALLVLIISFLPIMSLEADVLLKGKTNKREISISFDSAELGMFDIDSNYSVAGEIAPWEYEDLGDYFVKSSLYKNISEFKQYSSSDVRKGKADSVGSEILKITTLGLGYVEMRVIPILIPIISTVALISLGLIVWQILQWFALDKMINPLVLISKIITPIMTATVLGLTIATVAWANVNFGEIGYEKELKMLISVSVILSFIFSVAISCIPIKKKRKVVYVEEIEE